MSDNNNDDNNTIKDMFLKLAEQMEETRKLAKRESTDLSLLLEQASQLTLSPEDRAKLDELSDKARVLPSMRTTGLTEDPEAPTIDNPTIQDVALWMKQEVETKGRLSQKNAAITIRRKFSQDFVYKNANNNFAIRQDVLDAFLEITKETVVWIKGKRVWRIRREDDPIGAREVSERTRRKKP